MNGGNFAEWARQARDEIERSIEAAWADHVASRADETPDVPAREVVDDPSRHPWRLVDAAMDRLVCPDCGAALGSGPRGCGPCDLADGLPFRRSRAGPRRRSAAERARDPGLDGRAPRTRALSRLGGSQRE